MKKLLFCLLVSVSVMAGAQSLSDSVVMTINGTPVYVNEFLFMAKKNGVLNLADDKVLAEYVDLYKKFKLKVADAEALGLDKMSSFKEEFASYQEQLLSSYLADKAAEEQFVKMIYDRGNNLLEISHILFRLPRKATNNDTLTVYNKAMDAYNRLKGGADIDLLGRQLAESDSIDYERFGNMEPLQAVRAFENVVYNMEVGDISLPIRTDLGYHVVKLQSKKPNLGAVEVSHILLSFPQNATEKDKKKQLTEARKVLKLLEKGRDFAELANEYSADKQTAVKGGALPSFGQGIMDPAFEKAAFGLNSPGELSEIVESKYGYHIIQLKKKNARPDFESIKRSMISSLGRGEYNFDIYRSADEKLKKANNYVFFSDAYAELAKICDSAFPASKEFYDTAKDLMKPLFIANGDTTTQSRFAGFMYRLQLSQRNFAGDFMQEVFDLYVREVLTSASRKKIQETNPEYKLLLKEYRDGTLLFEVSNQKVWGKPSNEQKELEEKWMNELNSKYPVEINRPLLKKIVTR